MANAARPAMNVTDAIRTKRAVREFADRKLANEDIRAILDAGRRAQSSKNTQPWHFIAVTGRESLKSLSECGKFAGHLAGAALGVALVKKKDGWDFDLGQAAAYMQLAAWELGIGSCIASMWEPDKAGAILGLPADLVCDTMISFGHPAQKADPKPKSGGRRAFEDVVRFERWT